jgi:hypothetical protein
LQSAMLIFQRRAAGPSRRCWKRSNCSSLRMRC